MFVSVHTHVIVASFSCQYIDMGNWNLQKKKWFRSHNIQFCCMWAEYEAVFFYFSPDVYCCGDTNVGWVSVEEKRGVQWNPSEEI